MRAPASGSGGGDGPVGLSIKLPTETGAVVATCIALYVVQTLGSWPPTALVCVGPLFVMGKFQMYRWYTAPFFHMSIFHIGFNLMAFVPLASNMERTVGTLPFAALLTLLMTVAGLLHVTVAYALSSMFAWSLLRGCSVGLSGVIFALIVIRVHLSQSPTTSLFGICVVPSKAYPWILLLVLQVVLPNVSFLGHLCGCLAGYAYVSGLLSVVEPSPDRVGVLETYFDGDRVPGFVPVTGSRLLDGLPPLSTANLIRGGRFGRVARALRSSGGQASGGDGDGSFPGQGRVLRDVEDPPPRYTEREPTAPPPQTPPQPQHSHKASAQKGVGSSATVSKESEAAAAAPARQPAPPSPPLYEPAADEGFLSNE